jgi:hypothetical protein
MDALWDMGPLVLFALWLALQWLALTRMTGGWRVAAWVPAIALGAAFAIAVLGVLAGSDLAPIWVVLALPLCVVWLLALWLARGLSALVAG